MEIGENTMGIVFKKRGFFGKEKVTRVDENAIEVDGKTFPLSQIICVQRRTDGNIISFVGVHEQLDHSLLEKIVEGLACERPRADEQGNWLLSQSEYEFSRAFTKTFGDEYEKFDSYINYDWQLDEGQEAYELICKNSRIDEVKTIYDELKVKNPKIRWGSKGEIRKQCNSCGAVYCFTAEDLKRLARDARASVNASLLQVGGLMTGNYGAAIYGKQRDRKVVNLNRCPFCDSSNIVDWDPDAEPSQSIHDNETSAGVSAADEILKFKNLADQGIITMEEFEAKKKQLLGL